MQTMNTFLKSVFCLLLSLTSMAAFSQNQFDKRYLFKNYNSQNGLINSTIYSMAQDKHGFIWIGSLLGITRFDGKTFYHNAVPDIYDNMRQVAYIATTGNGNIACTAYMMGIY